MAILTGHHRTANKKVLVGAGSVGLLAERSITVAGPWLGAVDRYRN